MSVPMYVSLDLKEFSEGAVTTEFGREFHTSTTQFEKNNTGSHFKS